MKKTRTNELESIKKKQVSSAYRALYESRTLKQRIAKNKDFYCVNDLDADKQAALENIRSQSVLIETPPCASEYVLIQNIISDLVCKNKTALFVYRNKDNADKIQKLFNNSKIMHLDQGDKEQFYIATRIRHNAAIDFTPKFNQENYNECLKSIAGDMQTLSQINDVMYNPTKFGLSMVDTYSLSVSPSTDAELNRLYSALYESAIVSLNVNQLQSALLSIERNNKADSFFDYFSIGKQNQLIEYLKTDLETAEIDKIRVFIRKLLGSELEPFDIGGYPYSRYALAYSLDHYDMKNAKPLASLLMKLDEPHLTMMRNLSLIPPLILAFPYFQYKYSKKRKQIQSKLGEAMDAIRKYSGDFDLLNSVLEPKGLALVIDSIAYGNNNFLKKLLTALEDYIRLRELSICMKGLTKNERLVLQFCKNNSQNKEQFLFNLNNLLGLCAYYQLEIHKSENQSVLQQIPSYSTIVNRVHALRQKQFAMNMELFCDSFDQNYTQFFFKNEQLGNEFLTEINKKEDLMDIKQLMEKYGDFLMRLFPCWLMPMELTENLPEKNDLFDTAIFDNAETIDCFSVTDIINRAVSVIIMGDNNQLGVLQTKAKDTMSLYDFALERLPKFELYHSYPNKGDAALFFSTALYKNKLSIAPSTKKHKQGEIFEFITVSGDRESEAKAATELLKKLYRLSKEQISCGILALDSNHAKIINEQMELELKRSDAFKRDFNQHKDIGDDTYIMDISELPPERDIIILCLGISGSDVNKAVPQNIGVLLDSAVARAKKKIYLITSVQSSDINVGRNKGNLLLFKGFLDYITAVDEGKEQEAQKILLKLSEDAENLLPRCRYENCDKSLNVLKTFIEELGYETQSSIGYNQGGITMKVFDKESESYILGLDFDCNAYNRQPKFFEREILRSKFLTSRGLKVLRLWTYEWMHSRHSVLKTVEKELAAQKKLALAEIQKKHNAVPTVKIRQSSRKTIAADDFVIDDKYVTKILNETNK